MPAFRFSFNMNRLYHLAARETAAFFNSLIAYLVIGVFLLATGLFFWVFSGNVLETGFAHMDPLFSVAPWLYLLLIPALTMRMLSDEKRTGTLELLQSQPIGTWQIVLGKYLAALLLVLLTLAPTLIYLGSISWLALPRGNVDTGAIWGAYLGLLGVGAVFAAIGLFASSLTENQLVAFLLGSFLAFLLHAGFDFTADLPLWGGLKDDIVKLGVNEHYRSISRGVVDTRDWLYFLSLSFAFLLFTFLRLQPAKTNR